MFLLKSKFWSHSSSNGAERDPLETPEEPYNFNLNNIEENGTSSLLPLGDTIPNERPVKSSIMVPLFRCKSGLEYFHRLDVRKKYTFQPYPKIKPVQKAKTFLLLP